MKNKKMKLENEKGITLIALVITIIVLLILAGVTINLTLGDNGIFDLAVKAGEETKIASKDEKIRLQKFLEEIEKITPVTDKEPGKLEGKGTKDEPYIINSIEDLVVFSNEVTNGHNFEKADGSKEYVELGQSLDFASDKSYVNAQREDYSQYGYNGKLKDIINESGFITIGQMLFNSTDDYRACSFCGNFNGNGYTIYNLKIKHDINEVNDRQLIVGMFNQSYGDIENLNIEGNININYTGTRFSGIGLITGVNAGKITNCSTSGEINTDIKCSINIGGLVGSNSGQILECYNNAKIICKYEGQSATVRMGGLVGVNEKQSVNGQEVIVQNSYNIADIYAQNTDSTTVCYMGGIAGYNLRKIKNVYTAGKITNDKIDESYLRIGNVTFNAIDMGESVNSYYLENMLLISNTNNVVEEESEILKTSDEMKKLSFKELLEVDNTTSVWKIETNKNNGYPILYWQ